MGELLFLATSHFQTFYHVDSVRSIVPSVEVNLWDSRNIQNKALKQAIWFHSQLTIYTRKEQRHRRLCFQLNRARGTKSCCDLSCFHPLICHSSCLRFLIATGFCSNISRQCWCCRGGTLQHVRNQDERQIPWQSISAGRQISRQNANSVLS